MTSRKSIDLLLNLCTLDEGTSGRPQGFVQKLMEMIAGAQEGEVSLVALNEDEDGGRRYFLVGDGDDRVLAELADSVPRQQKEDGESKKEGEDDSLHKKKDHNHEDL